MPPHEDNGEANEYNQHQTGRKSVKHRKTHRFAIKKLCNQFYTSLCSFQFDCVVLSTLGSITFSLTHPQSNHFFYFYSLQCCVYACRVAGFTRDKYKKNVVKGGQQAGMVEQ